MSDGQRQFEATLLPSGQLHILSLRLVGKSQPVEEICPRGNTVVRTEELHRLDRCDALRQTGGLQLHADQVAQLATLNAVGTCGVHACHPQAQDLGGSDGGLLVDRIERHGHGDDRPGGRVLLIERTVDGRHEVRLPKGHIDAGESAHQAALREVCEETGIDDLAFDWGDRYFETGPYSRGKVARYYIASTKLADVTMGISPEIGVPEHHEWRWVTFDEAYDLGSPRVRGIVQWARQIIGA